MTQALSLKMPDPIFKETEKLLRKIRRPRNAYINEAVAFYNRCQKRLFARKRLKKDMDLLRRDTREFVKAFELLEDLTES